MASRFITYPEGLPPSADVVIIGGGPAGTAALWAIGRMAPELRCVLIEKSDRLGAGSSLASLENYRTCWPAQPLAKQMERSVEIFHHADDYLGEGAAQALAIRQQGYLFCAFTETHAAGLKADVARLHDIGLHHIEYLNADEVAYRFGWVGPQVIAAKYDPVAGWLDSNALIYRFAQATPQAQVILSVPEVHLCVEGGRITGIRTPADSIDAPQVIIAAGAGARAIGRTAGLELPLVVRPRQSFTTGWRHAEFPEDAPMLIGAAPYPHVRPEARDGAIFGWEYTWHSKHAGDAYAANAARDALIDPVTPPDSLKDMRFPSITLALLARQFGHAPGQGFADPRYLRSLSHNIGYYVYRDDSAAYRTGTSGQPQPYISERAILDAYPGVEGLFLSVAHVGHGIMSAPAAGEIIACRVLGQPLPDPLYAQFGIDVPWVDYDEAVL